jgi:hypothetical protein
MGEKRGACRILVGKPEGKSHLENTGVDGRIMLIGCLRSWMGL